jgi:hypothetical protein
MRKSLLLAALSLAAAAGCAAPAPLVRLTPYNPDVVWVSGRAVVSEDQDGVRVAAAFDEQAGDGLGIRVEVENASDERLEIAPADVTYTLCATEAVGSCAPWRQVADPERMLIEIDAARSREQANASNDQAAMVPFLILGAVGDVASIASRHPTNNAAAISSEMDDDANRHASTITSLDSEHQRWSADALRRTTLIPGRGTAGYVYVPVDTRAQVVWLQVMIDDRRFTFRFRQTVTQVGGPPAAARPGAAPPAGQARGPG